VLSPTQRSTLNEGVPALDLQEQWGEPLEVALMAGQHYVAGTVTVEATVDGDVTSVDVTINTEATDWMLTETHVAVAGSLEELPQTGSGNPQVGHFEFSIEHDPPVNSITYDVGDYETGQELFIAVHAVVQSVDGEETAWAAGLEFPGNSWATYFTYPAPPPPLTVNSPNGGESFNIWWDTITVEWESDGSVLAVDIDLYWNDEWRFTIAEGILVETGGYTWTEPWPYGDSPFGYKIRVTDSDNDGTWDDSDDTFVIGAEE
jgi:hypothetical protein